MGVVLRAWAPRPTIPVQVLRRHARKWRARSHVRKDTVVPKEVFHARDDFWSLDYAAEDSATCSEIVGA